MTRTFTPAEFAIEFPRAGGHAKAIRYLAIDCHPKSIPAAGSIACGTNEAVVMVGRTNRSNTKCVARYAIIPGNAAGEL